MAESYQWSPLKDCTEEKVEADLQAVFDAWRHGPQKTLYAGAPYWLAECKQENQRQQKIAKGYEEYRYTPDVLWTQPWMVGELKRSSKYEPLALAEVLHHASQLTDSAGNNPTPFIVTSASGGAWTRAALRYLFRNGLRKDSIQYLEVVFYRALNGQEYLWFEDPFAMPGVSEPPPIVPSSWRNQAQTWLRLDGSDSWVCVESEEHWVDGAVPDRFIYVSAVQGHAASYLVYLWRAKTMDCCFLVQASGESDVLSTNPPASPFDSVS